jgi:hypothetical protein
MLHVSGQRSRVAAMPSLPPGAGGRVWGRGPAPTLPSVPSGSLDPQGGWDAASTEPAVAWRPNRVQRAIARWRDELTAAAYFGFGTFLLYLVLFDQGQLSNVVLGSVLGHQNVLHEFFHDGRHLANAPCH